MVDRIQSLFHTDIIFLVKFQFVQILRHIMIVISKQTVDFAQLLFQLHKTIIVHRNTSERTQCTAQRTSCTFISICTCQLITFCQTLGNLLTVDHPAILLFQFFIFPGNQTCFFNLLQFKFRQGLFPGLGFLIHGLFFYLLPQFFAFMIKRSHFFSRLLKRFSAIIIQNFHMFLFMEQRLMLVLTVNIDQQFCQFLDLAGCYRFSVDFADTAAGLHPAADDDSSVLLFRDIKLCHLLGYFFIFCLKNKFYQAIICPSAQHILVKFAAQSQIHRTDQYRFTCTGLTGEDIQPLTEFYFCFFN